MLIDTRMEFGTYASVAGSGTILLPNQLDLWQGGYDAELDLYIAVAQPIITGGAAGTLQFALGSDTTAAISTSGSAQILYYTPVFATSATPIPAGTTLFIGGIPRSLTIAGGGSKRFLGLLAIIGTSSITAGSVHARLVEAGSADGWAPTPKVFD